MIDADGPFHLHNYLNRIGYRGEPAPTLECLCELIQCHTQAIPFENLDPLLHRPVSIQIEALERKLVHGRRGGYCYEQNLLFAHALKQIGFSVQGLAARVRWNRSDDDPTPRTHMLLKVILDGVPMICDVGFGLMTPTAPLRLETGIEQQTPHETYRLRAGEGGYELQARAAGEWKTTYMFGDEEYFTYDYELPNYYDSTREGSHFRHALNVARAWEGGRYTLSNARLTIRPFEGEMVQQELGSAEEIVEVLESKFHITVPDREALKRALQREGIIPPETQGATGA
jgi:N-hydroxyarylamine O-acetyltransferase